MFNYVSSFFFSALFPAGILGMGVVDSQGAKSVPEATAQPGSSPVKTGDAAPSIPTASTSTIVPKGIQLLTANSDELGREVLPVIFVLEFRDAKPSNSGKLDLPGSSRVKKLVDYFLSVELVGDFSVYITAAPATETTNAWSVQARVAIVPNTVATPTSMSAMGLIPGNVAVSAHHLGSTQAVLRIPPKVSRNLKYTSTFEAPARLICFWQGMGVKDVNIFMEGSVAPSGLDLWAFTT
jgi:hypothetical protein